MREIFNEYGESIIYAALGIMLGTFMLCVLVILSTI